MHCAQGWVANPETGKQKDIVVTAKSPNTLKDILIGGGIVVIGITYLTVKAFKRGSYTFELAELKALSDADLLDDDKI